MGHGSLLKFTSTRAAFARLGPGATPFPNVLARMQPSDSLPPSAPAPVPLADAYLDTGASSVPYGRRHVHPPTCRASETTHRLSVKPGYVEERRGPSMWPLLSSPFSHV